MFGFQLLGQEPGSMSSAEQLAVMTEPYFSPAVVAATAATGAIGGLVG